MGGPRAGGEAAPGWILCRSYKNTGEQTDTAGERAAWWSPGWANPGVQDGWTHPDLIAADLHVADRVSLVGPAVVAAELADGHLLGLAVV